MKTVLLTDGEFTGLIRSLRGLTEPVRIVGFTESGYTAHTAFLDGFYTAPDRRSAEFLPFLLDVIRREQVDLVFPVDTLNLEYLAKQAERIRQETGAVLITSGAEALHTANDKALLFEAVSKTELSGIVTEFKTALTVGELRKAVCYFTDRGIACISKPVCGENAEGFMHFVPEEEYARRRLSGSASALAALQQLDCLSDAELLPEKRLVMPYLPGEEWDVDVLVRQGELIAATVRKNLSMFGGLSSCTVTVNRRDLLEYSLAIVRQLGLEYLACLSFRADETGAPKLLEINPRAMGSIHLSTLAGNSLVEKLLGFPEFQATAGERLKAAADMAARLAEAETAAEVRASEGEPGSGADRMVMAVKSETAAGCTVPAVESGTAAERTAMAVKSETAADRTDAAGVWETAEGYRTVLSAVAETGVPLCVTRSDFAASLYYDLAVVRDGKQTVKDPEAIIWNEIAPPVRETYEKYYHRVRNKICDIVFNCRFAWDKMYHFLWTVLEDCFVQVSYGSACSDPFMLMPLGVFDTEKLTRIVQRVRDDFEKQGLVLTVYGINEEYLPIFERIPLPHEPAVWNEDFSDYLYSAEDLRTLAGRKYAKKRNHLTHFLKEHPEFVYESLSPRHFEGCLELVSSWAEDRGLELTDPEESDYLMIRNLFDHWDRLNARGGVILLGGRTAAFSIGSQEGEIAFIHFEKADASVDGLYTAINQLALVHEFPEARFVNREEDLGIPGLRQAKQSYFPVELVRKYKMRFPILPGRV